MDTRKNRETQGGSISGILLVGASVALTVVMVFHPTGHDLGSPETGARQAHVNVAVHGLALLAIPALVAGFVGLWRRLRPSDLSTVAFVFFGFGSVAALGASVASGFVATEIFSDLAGASEGEAALLEALGAYTHSWNQGFALVWILSTSLAILLWSAAIVATRRIPRWIGGVGLGVGLLVGAAVLVGYLRLDVHGAGIVVLAHSVWTVLVGIELLRRRPELFGSSES